MHTCIFSVSHLYLSLPDIELFSVHMGGSSEWTLTAPDHDSCRVDHQNIGKSSSQANLRHVTCRSEAGTLWQPPLSSLMNYTAKGLSQQRTSLNIVALRQVASIVRVKVGRLLNSNPADKDGLLGKRRKKKCDEKWPICSQCLRNGGATSLCTQSQSLRRRPLTPQLPTSGCPYNGSEDAARLFSQPLYSEGISTQRIEQYLLYALTTRSEAITSITSLPQDMSFSSLLQPLVLPYSATRSAALACGAVLLANLTDAAWLPIACYHHTRAIRIIRDSLMTGSSEQNLSAVLLLHLYEVHYLLCEV